VALPVLFSYAKATENPSEVPMDIGTKGDTARKQYMLSIPRAGIKQYYPLGAEGFLI